MKQLLKNLWSQRAQNVWLFAELVLVCFVACTQIDPIMVKLYYRSLPKGFDNDRLVVANIAFIKLYETMNGRDDNFRKESKHIKQKLLALDEVEQVNRAHDNMGVIGLKDVEKGVILPDYKEKFSYQGDTLLLNSIYYAAGEHFFETYGIQPVSGCSSAKELSVLTDGCIISRSLAEHLFGSAEAAIGKNIYEWSLYLDVHYTIRAVVEDVHVSDSYDTWHIYRDCGGIDMSGVQNLIVIRLKPDVNVQRFIEEQNYNAPRYASEHFTIGSFTAYNDIATSKNLFSIPIQSYSFNLSVATALFFLINLCLGVIGTFWMQTKRRTEESGIMRAFGATRWRIMGMFLAEGFVLTTLSMIITSILYLNYVKTGLGSLCINPQLPQCQPDPTWVADKPLHFCILAGIVYLVILIVVSIGITIPAWNIVRTKVVKALRDE
jgi:ABC-type antimicrobial peptide transport system permease subunit